MQRRVPFPPRLFWDRVLTYVDFETAQALARTCHKLHRWLLVDQSLWKRKCAARFHPLDGDRDWEEHMVGTCPQPTAPSCTDLECRAGSGARAPGVRWSRRQLKGLRRAASCVLGSWSVSGAFDPEGDPAQRILQPDYTYTLRFHSLLGHPDCSLVLGNGCFRRGNPFDGVGVQWGSVMCFGQCFDTGVVAVMSWLHPPADLSHLRLDPSAPPPMLTMSGFWANSAGGRGCFAAERGDELPSDTFVGATQRRQSWLHPSHDRARLPSVVPNGVHPWFHGAWAFSLQADLFARVSGHQARPSGFRACTLEVEWEDEGNGRWEACHGVQEGHVVSHVGPSGLVPVTTGHSVFAVWLRTDLVGLLMYGQPFDRTDACLPFVAQASINNVTGHVESVRGVFPLFNVDMPRAMNVFHGQPVQHATTATPTSTTTATVPPSPPL